MVQARCRYEVFCADPTPFELADPDLTAMVEGDVVWQRAERAADPGLFRLPAFGAPTPDQPEKFRHPVHGVPEETGAAIRDAKVCYVITAEKEDPEDFSYLEAAVALAGEIAMEKKGVVVDRVADIGYSAQEIIDQREVLTVRDTIAVHEKVQGGLVDLWTAGMVKYAQREFLVRDFPARHIEIGRRLMYDNLCHYAAFHCTIEAGQNMQYMRSNPEAKWFFSDAPDGFLLVSDCHPKEKKPIPGLDKFIELALPTFQKEMEKGKG